jgi:hypothetical protein
MPRSRPQKNASYVVISQQNYGKYLSHEKYCIDVPFVPEVWPMVYVYEIDQ